MFKRNVILVNNFFTFGNKNPWGINPTLHAKTIQRIIHVILLVEETWVENCHDEKLLMFDHALVDHIVQYLHFCFFFSLERDFFILLENIIDYSKGNVVYDFLICFNILFWKLLETKLLIMKNCWTLLKKKVLIRLRWTVS